MRPVLPAVAAALAALSVAGAAPDTRRVGRAPDGSVVTPINQELRPHGRQVGFAGRAAAVAAHPDGRTAAVLGAMGAPVTVVDLRTARVVHRAPESLGQGSSRGIAYSPDGRWLYASMVRGRVLRFAVKADGTLGAAAGFRLTPVHGSSEVPTGLAVSPDGARVYVALNRGNALAVLSARSGRWVARVPVGNAPNDVALAGDTVVVSNGAGRRARPGDRTSFSSGTAVVADPRTGGARTGTVTLLDRRTLRRRAEVRAGLHPSGVAVRGRYAFVANANSDTVSVLDVPAARVVTTIAVRPFRGAPFGSSVNDVTTFGRDRLLVTLGRGNALAVYRWSSPTRAARFDGMVPTAWYPVDVAVDRRYGRILVANNKGTGPAAVGGSVLDLGTVTREQRGSLSVMALPTAATLVDGIRVVTRNNAWARATASLAARPRAVPPVPVPERIGEPSLIRHVFYVIKENRTYDQVLGDDPRGNGDPRYLHFGADVTPNHHLLAQTFPLFDNFYAGGTKSADAHQWATQAFVSDYAERAYPAHPRGYSFDGRDSLVPARSGFLWENATRHGKTVRVYGEYANRTDASGTRSDVPSLDPLLARRYPPFDLRVSDTERMRRLLADLGRDVKAGTVPNLTIVQLPLDHTRGTSPGAPTPRSDVADNDLALGQFVEWLTHSPIWPRSAAFVFEDDAQNGPDHVDGTRTLAYVISPYARRALVDPTYWTQLSLIRTIEQILGLPPMNQMDLAAMPMTTAFTTTADLTPYTAAPRLVPEETNPPLAALSGAELAWAKASMAMDFSIPDAADEDLLNRAIWHSVRGFDVPYPGDPRVLLPQEVTS